MEAFSTYLDKIFNEEEKKLKVIKQNSDSYLNFHQAQAKSVLETSSKELLERFQEICKDEVKDFSDALKIKQAENDKFLHEKKEKIEEMKEELIKRSEEEVEVLKSTNGAEFFEKEEEKNELEEKLAILEQNFKDIHEAKDKEETEIEGIILQIEENGKKQYKEAVDQLEKELKFRLYETYDHVMKLNLEETETNFDNILFETDEVLFKYLDEKQAILEDSTNLEKEIHNESVEQLNTQNKNYIELSSQIMKMNITEISVRIKRDDEEIERLMKMIKEKEDVINTSEATKEELQKRHDKLSSNGILYSKLFEEERNKRRNIAVEIMDRKGNIRVYCRVRPVLDYEINQFEIGGKVGNLDCTQYPIPGEILIRRDLDSIPEHFEFDQLFKQDSTQEEVFYEVYPYIQKLLDGYSVCIFAYGQTGSGKTYTMEGPEGNPGVNYRALQTLFEISSENPEDFHFVMSAMEIYNDNIYDTLVDRDEEEESDNDDDTVEVPFHGLTKLKVRVGADGNAYVENLMRVEINNCEEAMSILQEGNRRRFNASHKLNDHSSRSHLIVTIEVIGKTSKGENITSKLNLIDLAGSERVTKTVADGARLIEAKHINKSVKRKTKFIKLSALGNVIKAVGEKSSSHVPYRDCKLTHILKDSLGGNSKVLMFVNVTPAHYNIQETVSSLQFASRCRKTDIGFAQQNIAINSAGANANGRNSLVMKARNSLAGGSNKHK